MAQRSRAIIAIASGLAVAGLASLVVARLADSPAADVVSATGHAAADPSALDRSLPTPAPTPGADDGTAPSGAVTVKFEGGMLAIRAHAVPLDEVLAAVTRSVGVGFAGSDDAREPVSIDAGPGPVSQVLSTLLAAANYGYAFVDGADGAGGARPARVILLRQSAAQRSAAAPPPLRPPLPMPDQAMPASADAPGVRQQRVLDELLDACKQQGCDTS